MIVFADSSSGESSEDSPGPSLDPPPETDVSPHVNIGSQFQCNIPVWNPNREEAQHEPSREHLLWDPGISKVCTESESKLSQSF